MLLKGYFRLRCKSAVTFDALWKIIIFSNFCSSMRLFWKGIKIVCTYLHSDFIIGVSLVGNAVSDGINDVDFKEVGGRGVSVIQGLLLARQPLRCVLTRHHVTSQTRRTFKILKSFTFSILCPYILKVAALYLAPTRPLVDKNGKWLSCKYCARRT